MGTNLHFLFKILLSIPIIICSCSPLNKDHKKLIADVMTKPEQIVEILNNCPFRLSPLMLTVLELDGAPAEFSCCINKFHKNYKITRAAVAKSNFDYTTLFVFVDNDSINWPIEFQFRTIENKYTLLNAIVLHDLVDGKCIDSMETILGIKKDQTN